MLNMTKRLRGIGKVKVAVPDTRARLVGIRLRPSDVRRLEKLAADAGCGISTFGRLIVEQYLAANPRRGGRR